MEHTNAWMDSYRPLLNGFDAPTESWKGLNYLSFITIAPKRIKKKFKPLHNINEK